ncbi:hypothetical protein NMG60_11026066 [Bertholletia excelsa]
MSKISFLNFKYGGLISRKSSPKQPQSRPSFNGRMQSSGNLLPESVFLPNEAEMKKVFDKFDTNKDGKISPEEYKKIVRALGKQDAESEVAKAFEAMDTDGDGFVDFGEFMAVQKSGGGVRTKEVQEAFRAFDLDGNGRISAEELREVLTKLGERCSLDACRKMVRGVDKDGDGLIDMDEFTTMMTRTLKIA